MRYCIPSTCHLVETTRNATNKYCIIIIVINFLLIFTEPFLTQHVQVWNDKQLKSLTMYFAKHDILDVSSSVRLL